MFHSELDRLVWVVAEADARFAADPHLTVASAEELDVLLVAAAWMRLALSYAHGVAALLGDGRPDAAAPVERALLELWADFRYLLRHGSRVENAARIEINAVIEMTDFLARNATKAGGEKLPGSDGAERQRAKLEARYPEIYAAVKAQRRRGRWHWSGLSRSQLLREVDGEDAPEIYGVLSWDAHAVMNLIRDIEVVDAESGLVNFGPSRDPMQWIDRTAFHVSGTLFYFWNEFARLSGRDPIAADGSV